MVDLTARDAWIDSTADDGQQTYEDEDYGDDGIYTDDLGEPAPRRSQAATAMVLAGLFFIFSLFVLATFNIDTGPLSRAFDFWSLVTWSWVFFGVMLVFLVWLLVLLFTAPARGDADWYGDEDDHPTAAYADDPHAADTITLRCPKCMNIFSLQDPWTRPFYHVCPHCEVRGVYTGAQDPPEVKAELERHMHGQGQSA